jgi:epoxyqueuosine reductase QueG
MSLQSKLEKEALTMGAAYFGVADLSLTQQGSVMPLEHKFILRYSTAISIGVPLNTSIVDTIGDQNDPLTLRAYYSHVYHNISPFINEITDHIYCSLMDEGYSAMPVPATETIDTDNQYSLFSHKMVANLAGLGWIGKSCLLITADRGPRVRWGTVLTNAQLEVGKPVETKCGKCSICVEACPAGAFKGRNFMLSEGREMRMSAQKCLDFLLERRRDIGVSACGQCVYICPWGKPKS